MTPTKNNILILFAHPALHKSRVNRALIKAAQNVDGVTIRDLYECYPDFDINVPLEQALLQEHDIIVLQHPIYWYSMPAILKQWIDLVLQYDFAYGSRGLALQGKAIISAVTTGGDASLYASDGLHGHTLPEFLLPIEKTAHFCHMDYLPPFVISGTHRLHGPDIDACAKHYCDTLQTLRDGHLTRDEMKRYDTCNDALASIHPD